ncbi:MAG: hypothetical protein ABIH34_03495 [Nanoarchaeota archaeon]
MKDRIFKATPGRSLPARNRGQPKITLPGLAPIEKRKYGDKELFHAVNGLAWLDNTLPDEASKTEVLNTALAYFQDLSIKLKVETRAYADPDPWSASLEGYVGVYGKVSGLASRIDPRVIGCANEYYCSDPREQQFFLHEMVANLLETRRGRFYRLLHELPPEFEPLFHFGISKMRSLGEYEWRIRADRLEQRIFEHYGPKILNSDKSS